MTNIDNEGFFDALRQARSTQRGDTIQQQLAAAARLKAEMLRYFTPVLNMMGSMHAAGVRFQAGMVPTREAAEQAARQSKSNPRVSISIDTRRELILEVVVRDSQMLYSAYIWEIASKTCLLETTEVSAVRAWLVDMVAQFEYQPARTSHGDRRRRTGMPPATPMDQWFPPEEEPVSEDDDETDGREQRVIDLNE